METEIEREMLKTDEQRCTGRERERNTRKRERERG